MRCLSAASSGIDALPTTRTDRLRWEGEGTVSCMSRELERPGRKEVRVDMEYK